MRTKFRSLDANWLLSILSLGIVGALYVGLTNGQALNEDFSVYLKEASNILHHEPLQDMGVVWQPSDGGPITFPALLPALMSLPLYFVGYNIGFFKDFQLALLLVGLVTFVWAMRSWGFSVVSVAASLLMFGLSPLVRDGVNDIGSDIPFLVFLLVALLAIHRAANLPSSSTLASRISAGLILGLTIFLATETRTVGIALVPTAAATVVARQHRIIDAALITGLAVFGILWVVEYHFVGSTAYGFVTSEYKFFTPMLNLEHFYRSTAEQWANAFPQLLILPCLIALVLLAAVGAFSESLRGNAAAVFIFCYTVMLLVLPDFAASGARYLMPHFLFLGAFACRGAVVLAGQTERLGLLAKWAGLGTALFGVVLFALSDSPMREQNIGTASPSLHQLFAFVKENIPNGTLVAVTKHRSFQLYTGRRAIKIIPSTSEQKAEEQLHRARAEYVVIKYSPPSAIFRFSDCPQNPLCGATHTKALKEIWQNADFRVFRNIAL